MADIKISQLGEALAVTDNDILPMTASGVTSKVKASTMKSYMVDDLDVSDLHDTTITTPTDDDGLVYDSTSQKWENVPIMTKEQWQKNGAYNILEITTTTQVVSGVTYTVNSNKTITAVSDGTNSNSYLPLTTTWKAPMTGKYKFVGCPSGGASNKYMMYIAEAGQPAMAYDYGDGVEVNLTAGTTYYVYIVVANSQTVNITFKPMITTDLNATYDDYVEFSMTNRDLAINVRQDGSVNKTFAYNNAICICSIIVKNLSLTPTGSWVTAYSLPSGIPKPKQETSFIANTFPYTAGKSNAVVGRVTTDGDFQIWLDSGSSTPVSQVAMNFMYPV